MIEDDDSDSDWNSTESDDSESNTSNSYIEEINWLTFFEVAFHPCSHSRGRELETSDIINDAEAIKPRISWLKLDLILPDAPKTIWKEMGATLSRIKRLEKLNFCGLAHEFTPTMVSEIFQADGPYQFPLKAMSLSHNAINSRHVEALLPFLESREELAMLNLENNDIDSEGARLLGEALQSIRIQSLFLSNNQMCAGWVSSILSSENSTHFVHLELGKNCIGLVDIEEIASFLRRENISLERISLGNDTDSDDGFDIEWLEILFESLKKNTITTEIHVQSLIRISDEIEADSYISLSDHISAACMKLVSNTSSFEAFCESNHFFHHLDTINVLDYDEQDEFDTLRLHQVSTLINQRTELSTNQKLRSKLRLIFFRDEFDIQPFLSMSPKAMPQVLEIVTRSEELITKDCYTPARFIKTLEGNLNAIYNFIRRWNVPVLFSYPFQVDEVEEMKSELARMQLESNLKLQQLRLEEGEKIKGLENAYRKLQSESEREMKILESEVRRLREENRCLELELQEIRLLGHNPHK